MSEATTTINFTDSGKTATITTTSQHMIDALEDMCGKLSALGVRKTHQTKEASVYTIPKNFLTAMFPGYPYDC